MSPRKHRWRSGQWQSVMIGKITDLFIYIYDGFYGTAYGLFYFTHLCKLILGSEQRQPENLDKLHMLDPVTV